MVIFAAALCTGKGVQDESGADVRRLTDQYLQEWIASRTAAKEMHSQPRWLWYFPQSY